MSKLLIVLLFLLDCSSSSFAGMAPYQLANVDWDAAVQSHGMVFRESLQRVVRLKGYKKTVIGLGIPHDVEPGTSRNDLQAINAVSSLLFPDLHWAGSPVLLPLDMAELVDEIVDSSQFANQRRTRSYFGQLRPLAFYPGPYGYRAYFRIGKSSTVLLSGSSIFYSLTGSRVAPPLEACSAIIDRARRSAGSADESAGEFYDYLVTYLARIGVTAAGYFGNQEAAIPCMFGGSLVEVHILCDFTGDADCRVRKVARSIIARLAFAGGLPRSKRRPAINDPVRGLSRLLDSLDRSATKAVTARLPDYGQPGDLLPGSGVNGQNGSRDFGIYGAILFPVDPTAAAQTVIYRAGQKCLEGHDVDKGATCVHNGIEIRKAPIGEWRDNFCEDRDEGNLMTCPEGRGHAGQDIWVNGMTKPGVHPLRAVVDAIAFRRFPAQAAVTLSDVNGSNIDYVYRHMRPSELTKHGIRPSRPTEVMRGCVLGFVDIFERVSGTVTDLAESGVYYDETPPHLHFEIRVPTQSGFQNVSPYWTLVQSHRFLSTKADSTRLTNRPCG